MYYVCGGRVRQDISVYMLQYICEISKYLVSKYAYSLKISVNTRIYWFFGPVNTHIY